MRNLNTNPVSIYWLTVFRHFSLLQNVGEADDADVLAVSGLVQLFELILHVDERFHFGSHSEDFLELGHQLVGGYYRGDFGFVDTVSDSFIAWETNNRILLRYMMTC